MLKSMSEQSKEMKKILKTYQNGNYFVIIYEDGTKVRFSPFDEFMPKFPENIDLKITSLCDANCPMCHESSSLEGENCDFSLPFFDTLEKGTELAIGGGNPLSHPLLESFLTRMKKQGVLCNLTLRQNHLFQNLDFVQSLIDRKLIYGVGISFISKTDALFDFCKKNENAILHLILGVHSLDDIRPLFNKSFKVLFLGFKRFGRGMSYYSNDVLEKTKAVKEVFFEFVPFFRSISLDNEAMKELCIEEHVSKPDFNLHFMGEEGRFTMYVDAVKKQYAMNSIAEEGDRYPLQKDIHAMFAKVRKEYEHQCQKKCL